MRREAGRQRDRKLRGRGGANESERQERGEKEKRS